MEELNSSDHSALQRMKMKLDSVDTDSRNYHFTVINITEEDAQEVEKAVLKEHDDRIAEMIARIRELHVFMSH